MKKSSQQVLVRRLETIRERYDKLIFILQDANPEERDKFLLLEDLMNKESTALKSYLGLLVDDPCPENDPNLVCSSCPKEAEHILDGTISAREAFFLKGPQDD